MWRKLKNFLLNISTYTDLRADLHIRQQVNELLRTRPALTLEEWFEFFWRSRGIAKPVIVFVYTHLEKYSGLQISRVKPSDHLEKDLKLTLVCYFDWHLNLCDDFFNWFGVDISENWELYQLSTVEEFVKFLNSKLVKVQST
jgi:hypothetical protein